MYFFDTLNVHGIIIFQEDDAHLRQPPAGKFFVLWGHIDLWRDVGSQGHRDDGEDAAWSLPHRSTRWGPARGGPVLAGCFGAACHTRE